MLLFVIILIMLISLDSEEIKTFPTEVRLFLLQYFNEKLSKNLVSDNQSVKNSKSKFLKTPNIVKAPNFTRHPSRNLIASNQFDWFDFLSNIIENEDGKCRNDFHFTIKPNNEAEVLFNSNGKNIIHSNPKSW